MSTGSSFKSHAYRLVLASASPQRKQILREAGYEFESFDPREAESAIEIASTPEELALAKARAKAQAVGARLEPPFPAIVVGVDTLVALGGEIVGKPRDRVEAAAILRRLSGTRHRVISGCCVWPLKRPAPRASEGHPSPEVAGTCTGNAVVHNVHPVQGCLAPSLAAACTWVQMREMTAEQIAQYVDSGESDGKAGAYAIQEKGDRFVAGLEGSFLNVVGFPLELFREMLPAAERAARDE